MKILEKIVTLFKKSEPCRCPLMDADDQLSGKLFKHYKNEKLYRYMFPASPEAERTKLVVVYQDIESEQYYTRPWNDFFSSVKQNGQNVPRFQEQK